MQNKNGRDHDRPKSQAAVAGLRSLFANSCRCLAAERQLIEERERQIFDRFADGTGLIRKQIQRGADVAVGLLDRRGLPTHRLILPDRAHREPAYQWLNGINTRVFGFTVNNFAYGAERHSRFSLNFTPARNTHPFEERNELIQRI